MIKDAPYLASKPKSIRPSRQLAAILLGLTLAGCGGGNGKGGSDGGTPPAVNVAPVVNAGAAQSVSVGAVTLDGSATDANGDTITFAWTFVSKPAGSNAVLANAATAKPTFTADLAGTYVLALVASDGKLESTAASVTITVIAPPVNAAPVANAGSAQSVNAGVVTLDGSATDANSDPLTFAWTFSAVPAGSTAAFSNSTAAKPTFSADLPGTYIASLVANDGKINSAPSTVTITVAAPPVNFAPVANAGAAQSVGVGVVTLNGSATDANADPLTYAWTISTKPAGSSAALSDATAAKPTFNADVVGTYIATLVANDGKTNSAPSTVTITVTAVAPPAIGTMGRALTPTLNADQSGCAKVNTYEIGPGKQYTKFSQVPWSLLKGCDTVKIHAKPGKAPYNEMILLSAGVNTNPTTATTFMRVIGVADPVTGDLPIIDGRNATQRETVNGAERSLQYWENNNTSPSLYALGLVMVSGNLGRDYNKGPAGYIGIENLDIRNAEYHGAFTNGKTGLPAQYGHFTACLFVEVGSHLVIKNNIMQNCNNGMFINSKNNVLVELSQDILVEGNRFLNNGNAAIPGVTGAFSEHHIYTEARGVTYQYNYFGDMRTGSSGDCIKDRSSGITVRYNTFESNCGIKLHLVDAASNKTTIVAEANYGVDFVYGNSFEFNLAKLAPAHLLIYGGDTAYEDLTKYGPYRQKTLSFYNNTIAVRGDANYTAYSEMSLFTMMHANAIADVRNNVFYSAPATAGANSRRMAFALGGPVSGGTLTMSNNWVSANATEFQLQKPNFNTLTGWNTNINGGSASLFAGETVHNFRPKAGSALIDAAGTLGTLAPPTSEPTAAKTRKIDGELDIGAFEY